MNGTVDQPGSPDELFYVQTIKCQEHLSEQCDLRFQGRHTVLVTAYVIIKVIPFCGRSRHILHYAKLLEIIFVCSLKTISEYVKPIHQ